MAARLGENIQREWDAEPLAIELWDALQARKTDHDSGMVKLTILADRGSALAMMYLGHAYVKSGDREQAIQGEAWLMQSAEMGSIEGRFQLAAFYERDGQWERLRTELEALIAQNYSPAMYELGRLLYNGKLGYRSAPEAIAYLRRAIEAGHLPSIGLLSQIYRKERFGVRGKIASHWLCLIKIPAIVRCMWSYPSSDRMRPYGSYHKD